LMIIPDLRNTLQLKTSDWKGSCSWHPNCCSLLPLHTSHCPLCCCWSSNQSVRGLCCVLLQFCLQYNFLVSPGVQLSELQFLYLLKSSQLSKSWDSEREQSSCCMLAILWIWATLLPSVLSIFFFPRQQFRPRKHKGQSTSPPCTFVN
jgi:hypothetical protein